MQFTSSPDDCSYYLFIYLRYIHPILMIRCQQIFMRNQINYKSKYDRTRDTEARREYRRNYYKRKNEECLNIERGNQSQLEVEASMQM